MSACSVFIIVQFIERSSLSEIYKDSDDTAGRFGSACAAPSFPLATGQSVISYGCVAMFLETCCWSPAQVRALGLTIRLE